MAGVAVAPTSRPAAATAMTRGLGGLMIGPPFSMHSDRSVASDVFESSPSSPFVAIANSLLLEHSEGGSRELPGPQAAQSGREVVGRDEGSGFVLGHRGADVAGDGKEPVTPGVDD